jgi:hypothetical protein
VLDQANVGRQLRAEREKRTGRWQGPLNVPPGSIMLCVGLGSIVDDLATELLVRILRDQKIDARHISVEEMNGPPPPQTSAANVAVVYIVSALPGAERDASQTLVEAVRRRLPNVRLVTLFLPGVLLQPASSMAALRGADDAATSFVQALQICLDLQNEVAQSAPVPSSKVREA